MANTNVRFRLVFPLLAILALPAWVPARQAERPQAPQPITVGEKAKLARLLPEPRVLKAAAAEPRFYSSDLYKYIDGGAEAYHARGLLAMVHRQYKAKDLELTIDVFDLGNPHNAQTIYAAERNAESRFIAVGTEGYIDQNILNFVQAQFYVKITAFSDTQKPEAAMRAVAGDVSRRIGGSKPVQGVDGTGPKAK